MSGVFERFPTLKFVLTEQGCVWLPSTLAQLDGMHMAATIGRIGELKIDIDAELPLSPSEYFQRNVWIGASFPQLRGRRGHEEARAAQGDVGQRLPAPRGRDALHPRAPAPVVPRLDAPTSSTRCSPRRRATSTASTPTGWRAGRPRSGPTVAELAEPLDKIPAGATSPAFYM